MSAVGSEGANSALLWFQSIEARHDGASSFSQLHLDFGSEERCSQGLKSKLKDTLIMQSWPDQDDAAWSATRKYITAHLQHSFNTIIIRRWSRLSPTDRLECLVLALLAEW